MEKLSQILKEKKWSAGLKFSQVQTIDFSENESLIKNTFMKSGKNLIGEKFTVLKCQSSIITELLKYFTGNQCIYDLNKGIYLFGIFGIGKSMLFEIIRKTISDLAKFDEFGKKINPNGFLITSSEQIIETYKHDGNLDYYGYRKESVPIDLLINEFGKKLNDKIYGTDANELLNSLFMIRYELFQRGILTHVTSNSHPDKLDLQPILLERAIEMFNFVELNGESFRK
jgi:predicted ATPase